MAAGVDNKLTPTGVGTDATLPQVSDSERAGSPATLPAAASGTGERAADSLTYKSGDLIAERYRVVRAIGEGGIGEVYEADDLLLKERVALKTLRQTVAHDETSILRFKREVQLARKVTHPNVCRLFDVGLDKLGGREAAFLTMELLAGETLSARIRRVGRLSTAEALPIAEQVAAALAAAHAAGIIHRDLKCANIILVETPQGLRAVVTDMGLARVAARDTDQLTGDGVVGSPAYMAPEQVEGDRHLTAACDLYAFGVVLYEMVTGKLPFAGETPLATAVMRLREPPPPPRAIVPDLDARWERAILACLERAPEARPAQADHVVRIFRTGSMASARRRAALVAAAAVVVALVILSAWFWHNTSRAHWARETATPEVERLIAAEEYGKAAALARRALEIIPDDATLEKLWTSATFEVSVESTPAGADVRYRPYRSNPQSWTTLGRTPVLRVRVPRDFYVWQVSKPGFLPAWQIAPDYNIYRSSGPKQTFRLVPEESVAPGMVSVPGGEVDLLIRRLESLPRVTLDDFLIDRHEVTNEEYKKFVDAGGYRRPELWKEPFVRDGRPVPREQAMGDFQDATGHPGPSTWELGKFPKDQGNHPVAGVSWYEAAAYSAFAGKSLPTIYHWNRAAGSPASGLIVPGSNFAGTGTVPVGGEGALSGFGTYDMAGNVKEWCLNESQNGKRYVLGGGFGEPTYMFIFPDAQSPWSRTPNVGFRCAKLSAPPAADAARLIEEPVRDYRGEKPVSDEVFRAYQRQYAYDRTSLNARVESTEETEDWTRERVSFDAAYGGERVIAYLYLPKSARPPFQTVVYFPGTSALLEDKYELSVYADFIPKSGRALLAPIFKSTFERRDALKSTVPKPTAFYRDHMVAWSQDLGRSLDYLETRKEIDRGRIAYFGLSWGGAVAPVMLAIEDRFKVAVLMAGGLSLWGTLPEVDAINFVGRVRTPILMLNGRYDHLFPVETSQRPLFDFFGTPAGQKKHIVYETGHTPLRKEVIRESLSWLDTYLGPVGK